MQFVKMHGAGNDFVVVDLLSGPDALDDGEWSQLAIEVCDRHFGIGADGLVLIAPSISADIRMRIFNPDGSEAESCGNGIRCLGRYYWDRYAPDSAEIRVETGGGPVTIWVRPDGSVTVDMGPPNFKASHIPVLADGPEALGLNLDVGGRSFAVSCVSMGNPHAVTFVEHGALEGYPLGVVGPAVERHPSFPRRINFDVGEVLDRGRIRLRVWERGAGPTLACGTGACATVAVARRQGLVGSPVEVELPGGTLTIAWDGSGNVLMTGPAEYVFTGAYARGQESGAGGRGWLRPTPGPQLLTPVA